jgi:hypothetical protein
MSAVQHYREKKETTTYYQHLNDEDLHPDEYWHKIEVIQHLMPSLYKPFT